MKGFIFIELLVVLGILVVITIVVTPFFSTSISRNDLQTSAWKVGNDLRRAQGASMAAEQNSGWSVHFQADKHVLFMGSIYNASDPNNVETILPSTLSLSAISLNGGGSDVRFNKIRGTTSDFGSVTLLDNNSGGTIVVEVNASGRIK